MVCPESGTASYGRKTKAPDDVVMNAAMNWGVKPELAGLSWSSFDRSPTAWSLVVDAPFIRRRRVFGQGFNADAWASLSRVGRRFRHFYSCGGATRRGHFHNLGNNCAVGWACFRYLRKAACAPGRGFAHGLGYFGVRSGVELWFPTGHSAYHRRRISNDSPDHNGGAGRYITA